MSYKTFEPAVRFGGVDIDPDEINRYEQYVVLHPSISTVWFGSTSAAGSTGGTSGMTVNNLAADYPRNVCLTLQAGTVNGTCTVIGHDQFGQAQTETLSTGTVAGPRETYGTKVFADVTAATVVWGTGQAVNGTGYLGVGKGTASGSVCVFGLPLRIGAATDVKSIGFVANGAGQVLNGGTPSALVSTVTHSFQGTQIVAATDSYVVKILTTFNGEASPVLA